jgi:hypothetical protein
MQVASTTTIYPKITSKLFKKEIVRVQEEPVIAVHNTIVIYLIY